MVGADVIKKAACLCTKAAPCDRKAGPGEPGFCDYCFRLDGPCPATGYAPLIDPPVTPPVPAPLLVKATKRAAPRKKTK